MIKSMCAVLAAVAAGAVTVPVAVAGASATTAAGASAGVAAPAAHGASCRAGGYEPVLDPANFARDVTNPYFPLPVGRTLVYRGIKDGKTQVDRVHVTAHRKVLEGISAVAVTDVSTHKGKLLEKTTDWYAQDKQGNVWYLGERTAAFSGGHVDHSGSWQGGKHDAEPGIVMQAHPRVPSSYRQECLPGQAEDMAWTVVRDGALRLPFRTVTGVLASLEFTRLEPGVIDRKVYAPGLGIVLERAMSGPKEFAKLVRVHG